MQMIKLVALTLVLTGCNFDSKEPDRLNVDTAVKMDESSISLPISIQAGEIQSLLQEAINENSNGNRLFFESGRKVGNGVSIQTDVKTRGNVTVYARNNNIEARLPLHVDLRADWEKCKRINLLVGSKRVCVKHHEDTNAQFTVIAKLSPRLNSEYKLEPNIDLDYALDRGAQIKVGPIEINLVSKTREALNKQMEKFQAKLDASLQGKINAKAQAQKAWDLAQKPIQLIKDEVWLLGDISSLHATPLFTANNAAHLGIGIKGSFSISLGDPDYSRQIKPLPALETILPTSGFILNIPVIADYSELEKQANKRLKEYQIDYEGNKVTVKKVSVFGTSSGRLVVGANVNLKSSGDWFGTTGWVYLLGTPEFSQSKSELTITDIEYDVNTESAILDTAAWAASPFIKGKIEEALRFDISKDLTKAKKLANEQMKDITIENIGNLTGSLSTFEVSAVTVQSKGVQITAKASGDMRLNLANL